MTTVAEVAGRLKRPAAAAPLPRMLVMTDSARLPDPIAAVGAMPPDAALVFRHYDSADRRGLAKDVARACRRAGVRLLIAGDARLAREVGADGLHLPEWMVRRDRRWRQLRRAGWIVTAAAHNPRAIEWAAAAGADAVVVSPVFATRSHPGAPILGPIRLARWARRAPVPVYALGGVDAGTARRLLAIPLAGLAGIRGFVVASEP